MNRTTWKWWYRLQRIALREARKASVDTLLYGSGYVRMQPNGEAVHVPWRDVQND